MNNRPADHRRVRSGVSEGARPVTGRLEAVEGRPALRFERHLDHPVERVWRAVTEPGELGRWFVAPVSWTPALGETFEGEGGSGAITELDPPHVIAWTWGDHVFRFDLRPDGERCLLVFTHVFDDRLGPPAQHAAGWEAYLDRLDAHLAGGFLSEEDAHAVVPGLQERYRELFDGRAEGAARAAATLEPGSVVRIERRYEHPIERVWRAVTEPDDLRHWFPPGEGLQVTESDPPRVLAGTWFGSGLRFELRPDGDGCVLVVSQHLADRVTAARDGAGWDRCLARLDGVLAGEPMGEAESLEGWPEIHERLAREFGVDPEVGRRAFSQHATQR